MELKVLRLERCSVFRLDLPGQRQTMAIRARSNRLLPDVVEPILVKYGVCSQDVIMHIVRTYHLYELINVSFLKS